jgi:hypothetical protein
MPLSPPLCLNVYYSNLQGTADPNLYSVTFSLIGGTPQYYLTGQYDCTTIAIGMWTGNSPSGYVFRIHSISNQTVNSCEVVLEDVNGFNAVIDTSQGFSGGGPNDQSPGYVYELNANGLPVLTAADNIISITWTDAQLGRFLYHQPAGSGGGAGTQITGDNGAPTMIPTSAVGDFYIDYATGNMYRRSA